MPVPFGAAVEKPVPVMTTTISFAGGTGPAMLPDQTDRQRRYSFG
jgi:hypothetical protein